MVPVDSSTSFWITLPFTFHIPTTVAFIQILQHAMLWAHCALQFYTCCSLGLEATTLPYSPPSPHPSPSTPEVSAQCHVSRFLHPRDLPGTSPLRCVHSILLIIPLPSCNKLISFVIIRLNSSFSFLCKLQKGLDCVRFVSQGIPGAWHLPNK